MYVDALTLSAVVTELRDAVMGGRIQRIIQPTPDSLGLEIYAGQRVTLLLSAHPQRARIQLTSAKLTRGVDVDGTLMLLLRKYAKNGSITAIKQPSLERIVTLSITKYPSQRKDDEDDVTEVRHTELIIEVLGGRSNIILTDAQGRILDALKRSGQGQRRVVEPHALYVPPSAPPAQGDPQSATASGLLTALDAGEADLVKAIVGTYRGVSPQVAREALFRATGETTLKWGAQARSDISLEAIAAELSALYSEPFAPSLAFEGEQPLAFAPYQLDQYPVIEQRATMSEALDEFFARQMSAADLGAAHAARRATLAARFNEVRKRYTRQHDALARELERAQSIDQLRWEGEMIYSYLHTLEPGQRSFEVDGVPISLDPEKTAVENAQGRFRAYDKAKGAVAGVPDRLAETEAHLAYLDETLALLDLAEGFDEIAAFEREAEQQGVLKGQGSRPSKGLRAKPLRVLSSAGIPIFVGRSAGQNDEVTFTLAQPNDVWLHARGVPGAHVIIRWDVQVDDQTLLEAAGLALYYSKARNQPAADVSLCRRRDVRKVSGGPPGLVTLRNERTLRVRPMEPGEVGKDEG